MIRPLRLNYHDYKGVCWTATELYFAERLTAELGGQKST